MEEYWSVLGRGNCVCKDCILMGDLAALGTQKSSGAQGWEKKVVSWQLGEGCFKAIRVVTIARAKRNVEKWLVNLADLQLFAEELFWFSNTGASQYVVG